MAEDEVSPAMEKAIHKEVEADHAALELDYSHRRMKFYAIISIAWGTLAVLLAFALISFSGDSTLGEEPDAPAAEPRISTMWVEVPDGRIVPCVWGKDGGGGGLTCDWAFTGPVPENATVINHIDGTTPSPSP